MNVYKLRVVNVGFVLLLITYPLFVFESDNYFNPINVFLYMLSGVLLLWALTSVCIDNINGVNIFVAFYFGSMFFNTLNLSEKQHYRELIDIYYFILAPLILIFFVHWAERVKVNTKSFYIGFKFEVNKLYLLILAIYVFLKLYIGFKVGFRIMDYGDVTMIPSGDKYTIPGVSGVSAVLQWTLLVLVPFVKKRYSALAVVCIIVLSGILHVKRGDIMRVMLFLSIYSISKYLSSNKISVSFLLKCFSLLFLILLTFTIFGQYRLAARGGDASVILTYLGSRVDSVLVAWIYSYFSFNFEVLKLYFDVEPIYNFAHILSPFLSFEEAPGVGGVTISGFNAATFIAPIILDFGVFYPIELIFYSFFISLSIVSFRVLGFSGARYFIYTMLALMIFGDYFYERSIILSIVFFMLLVPFIKFSGNEERI
ncbi:hypothetical protein BCU71_19395 [Vibrio lentus]|uniref:O-antigen polymerase n=1 Tax=Vibrio lentus TaxID=136468 RepID=UPI000C820A8D|nr:O-antigen polymerase [Vibrio lentus]PMH28906.1 hypothetical protein BCU71_19395 [Vibrio lentus]PMK68431.1 hypothetical protein BCT93_18335 [Vibrio lentus]